MGVKTHVDDTEERFRSAYSDGSDSVEYYVTNDQAFQSVDADPPRSFYQQEDENDPEDDDVAFRSTTDATYSKRDGFDLEFFSRLLHGFSYDLTAVSEDSATYTATITEPLETGLRLVDIISPDAEPAATTPRTRPREQFPDNDPVRRNSIIILGLRDGFISGEVNVSIGPDAIPMIGIDVVTEGEQRRFEHSSTHEFQRNIPSVVPPIWVPE